jgi:2',3'-cyclic-nucleotide 2'-phosphodiesterase (5'-nucleotidase family)
MRSSTLILISCVAISSGLAVSGSGGRAPSNPDKLSQVTFYEGFDPRPPHPSEARLTVVQITDVYTLANFASLRTLLKETRSKSGTGTVVSVLTGDFLAPYLLSSVDRGTGMMNALAKTPIDYLTWGNHEADIDHRTVCNHVRNFPGTWINSNMQDHEAMDSQVPFEIIEITSPDGTNNRRIGLVAVLSNDSKLYSHFQSPGAFGGATIGDPWQCLAEYATKLMAPPFNCDMILPLQHTYVPDDHKTCAMFDFPVVLSGHDHHRVDEYVEGTRLLKPGLDAIYATMLDLSWKNCDMPGNKPDIRANFVKCDQWEPDHDLLDESIRAYDALAPLRNTELARVPKLFEPLSSEGSRGKVCTMGKFICSLLRSSLNVKRGRQRAHMVEAVVIMGGNIRGGTEYPAGSFFSLEALEAEIKANEVVGVVLIPGWVLSDAISETHSGDPIPGWLQYDQDIVEEFCDDGPSVVTHVAGSPIDRERIYRVATKVEDLTNGQSKTLTAFFNAHPENLPPKGAYVNIHSELMSYFSRNLWRKIWEAVEPIMGSNEDCGLDEGCDSCMSEERFKALDLDHDGIVSVDEIHNALRDVVGLSVDDSEKSLAKFVHSFADVTRNGKVTVKDFEVFCKEIPDIYEADKWRLAFPKASGLSSLAHK